MPYRRLLKSGLAGVLVAAASYANAANTPLASMPSASTLAGTEVLWCQQSGADRQCTPSQMATYALSVILAQGYSVSTTTATQGSNPNFRRSVDVQSTLDISNLNPGFTDAIASAIQITPTNGDNSFAGGTNAKTTFAAQYLSSVAKAAGQRFVQTLGQICYGMGDCFLQSKQLSFASSDNVQGDEGIGFTAQSLLTQQTSLALAAVSSKPTQSIYSSTTTQAITASFTSQTVTVASTTNAAVNDWIVVEQAVPTGQPNIEAVQITAVGSGSITAVFRNNHGSGVTLTPALVLNLSDGSFLGQGRVLINLSGTSYATGTVSSISGGAVTGSGTSWASNVVGGSSTNVAAIAFTDDDYSAAPFNGSGATGTLKSWYQVTSVGSATSLGIFTYSVAGDAAYRGKAASGSAYIMRPAARVLRVNGAQVICETSAATWSATDNVELAISPYPDITAESINIAAFTPGGTYRNALSIRNEGGRTFQSAITIDAAMPTGGGADTVGWTTAISLLKPTTGIQIFQAATQALSLGCQGTGGSSDNNGKISWNGPYITCNTANEGMDWSPIQTGDAGVLSFKSNSAIGSGTRSAMQWDGMDGTTADTFSRLPTCASGTEGLRYAVKDSATATWGATITGSGSNHVGAYCDGTNWTVYAK